MKWFYMPLLCLFSILTTVTKAAESEPNNTTASADSLALNGSHTGAINIGGDIDWYKLITPADGKLNLNLTTASGKYITVSVYDANGTSLLKTGNSNGNFTVSYDGAAAGIYYIKVAANYAAETPAYTIADTLLLPAQATDTEPNNTRALAKVIAVNATATGHIGYANNSVKDSADWFKLTTTADGLLKLKITAANGQNLLMYLFDYNGTTQLNYGSGSANFSLNTDGLAAGTYYILVKPLATNGFAPYTITDSLYTPAVTNDAEPNNSYDKAIAFSLNTTKKGHSGYYYNLKRDTADWYKVTAVNNGQLRLKVSLGNSQYLAVSIYDTNATTLLKSASGNVAFDVTRDGLAPGTYFIKVSCYYSNVFNTYTMTDSFYNASAAGDIEPNNTPGTAGVLDINSKRAGEVGFYYNNQRDSLDWYKITTPADGLVRLKLKSGNGQPMYAYLYDYNGTTQLAYASGSDSFYVNMDGLTAGTYFIKVKPTASNGFGPYTLTDSLILPAEANDTEPNNSFDKAVALLTNTGTTGHVGYYYNLKRDSSDWYKINTAQDGMLKILLKPSNTQYLYAYLYDADGKTLLKSGNGNTAFSFTMDGLAAGSYFVKVAPYYSNGFAAYTLQDSLFAVPVANDAEPNNTALQAVAIDLNTNVTGHIGYYNSLKRDSTDWYKITTNADGMLKIKLAVNNAQNLKAELFDKNGTTSLKTAYGTGNVILKADGLAPNTYYLKINSYNTTGFQGYTLTDSLLTYNYANDAEPNNKPYLAKAIAAGSTVTGHTSFYANALRDSTDWWKISYNGTSNTLKFGLNIEAKKSDGTRAYVWCFIYRDTSQSPIFSKYYNAANNAVSVNAPFSGNYYIKIFPYYTTDFASYAILDSNGVASTAKVTVVNAVPATNCTNTNSLQYAVSGGIAPYSLQLYRNGLAYGSPLSISSGYTFNSLPTGRYYARVYSFGASGEAYGQSAATALVPIPTNPSARIVTNTSVTLKWSGYPCVKYYRVLYRDKIVGSWATKQTSGNIDSLNISNLISNNTYQFQVAAVDTGNNVIAIGKYSVIVDFTTTPPAQTSFAAMQSNDDLKKLEDANMDLQAYPNPATSLLHIRPGKNLQALSLHDINGKKVWQATGAVLKNGMIDVNVSSLTPGMYLLNTVDVDSKTTTKKIMITR